MAKKKTVPAKKDEKKKAAAKKKSSALNKKKVTTAPKKKVVKKAVKKTAVKKTAAKTTVKKKTVTKKAAVKKKAVVKQVVKKAAAPKKKAAVKTVINAMTTAKKAAPAKKVVKKAVKKTAVKKVAIKKAPAKKKVTVKKSAADKISTRDLRKIRRMPKPSKLSRPAERKKLVRVLKKAVREVPSPITFRKEHEHAPAPAPQPQPQGGPYIDKGMPIPHAYGDDRIVAMVRDPGCLYLYWEFSGSKRESIAQAFGEEIFHGAMWVLRVHHFHKGIEEDIPVLLETGNWYLYVMPGGVYMVEIGLLTKDKRFIALARTEVIYMPAGMPADETDERWMVIEEDFKKMMELTGVGAGFGGSSAERHMLWEKMRKEAITGISSGSSSRFSGERK